MDNLVAFPRNGGIVYAHVQASRSNHGLVCGDDLRPGGAVYPTSQRAPQSEARLGTLSGQANNFTVVVGLACGWTFKATIYRRHQGRSPARSHG